MVHSLALASESMVFFNPEETLANCQGSLNKLPFLWDAASQRQLQHLMIRSCFSMSAAASHSKVQPLNVRCTLSPNHLLFLGSSRCCKANVHSPEEFSRVLRWKLLRFNVEAAKIQRAWWVKTKRKKTQFLEAWLWKLNASFSFSIGAEDARQWT